MEKVAINQRSRIFLLRKGQFMVMIRKFANNNALLLPGGGVEGRETFEQAIIREVKEELEFEMQSKPIFVCDYINERVPHPDEAKRLKGTTLVRDEYHFYRYQLKHSDQVHISSQEKSKFITAGFIFPSEIDAMAARYNADIGPAIKTALAKLTQTT